MYAIRSYYADCADRQFTGMESDARRQTVGRDRLIEAGHGVGHLQRGDAGFLPKIRIIGRPLPNGEDRIALEVDDETIVFAHRLEERLEIP